MDLIQSVISSVRPTAHPSVRHTCPFRSGPSVLSFRPFNHPLIVRLFARPSGSFCPIRSFVQFVRLFVLSVRPVRTSVRLCHSFSYGVGIR